MLHAGLVNIITAYSPHRGRPMTDVDRFYADLIACCTNYPGAVLHSSMAISMPNSVNGGQGTPTWGYMNAAFGTATGMYSLTSVYLIISLLRMQDYGSQHATELHGHNGGQTTASTTKSTTSSVPRIDIVSVWMRGPGVEH